MGRDLSCFWGSQTFQPVSQTMMFNILFNSQLLSFCLSLWWLPPFFSCPPQTVWEPFLLERHWDFSLVSLLVTWHHSDKNARQSKLKIRKNYLGHTLKRSPKVALPHVPGSTSWEQERGEDSSSHSEKAGSRGGSRKWLQEIYSWEPILSDLPFSN